MVAFAARVSALDHQQFVLFDERSAENRSHTLFDSAVSPSVQKKIGQFSEKKQEKFNGLNSRFLTDAGTAFEQTFRTFWLTRYRHYSIPEKFYARVAKVFSLSPEMVEQLESEFQLPGVSVCGHSRKMNDAFTASIYLDDEFDYTDPVDRLMRGVFSTRRSREIWTDYCTLFGRLSIDQIQEADLNYVLTTYALSIHELAKVFHVKSVDLRAKAGSRKRPKSYPQYAAPVRVLITKHPRLRRIALRYAHLLYTSQAIPIPRIAQTLGLDPTALYNLGEQVIGDWHLPSPNTLHYVIEQTTLMHLS
ncbi:hypothetical protein [Marinobacter gelidimuriae]|uniref:hypothetical protein n=1 Tax=Marinobacter gelidimuriae TaxID=2739064 RepID=UPI00035EE7D7|nr:hypothetical protein [Marinobacter gelidimuriae]